MIITVHEENYVNTAILPEKVFGHFVLRTRDGLNDLAVIDGVNRQWIIKAAGTGHIQLSDGSFDDKAILCPDTILTLISEVTGKTMIITGKNSKERHLYRKYTLPQNSNFTIGSRNDNDICYRSPYVSQKHAEMAYRAGRWYIRDLSSTNGTYVNKTRIEKTELKTGDVVFIEGLQIMVGPGFIALNSPDGNTHVGGQLRPFYRSNGELEQNLNQLKKQYFYVSPRFKRDIETVKIKLDPPPQSAVTDELPWPLLMGSSLAMGGMSMITIISALSTGNYISVAMGGTMLTGSVFLPAVTRRYERKKKKKREILRQEKYRNYLANIARQIDSARHEQESILAENFVSIVECENRIIKTTRSLWERTARQDDFLTIRLGTGRPRLDAEITGPEKHFELEPDELLEEAERLISKPQYLNEAPITLSLKENRFIGVIGNSSRIDFIKGLIVQLSAYYSYEEIKTVFFFDPEDEEEFAFSRLLPHSWNNDRSFRTIATKPEEAKELSKFLELILEERKTTAGFGQTKGNSRPHYLVFCLSNSLNEQASVLSAVLNEPEDCGISVIFSSQRLGGIPKECTRIVEILSGVAHLIDPLDVHGKATEFTPDIYPGNDMKFLASRLMNTFLDIQEESFGLPDMLSFLEMYGVGKIEHLNMLSRWRENDPVKSLSVPVGIDGQGKNITLDLHERAHGPHGLIAGMTGSGKSEFIITYILSLAVNFHPDEVSFLLIDYKGGGLAGAFDDPERGVHLPHLSGTITNLDGSSISRSLVSIQSELRRRQVLFNSARKESGEGTIDIYKYQKLYRNGTVSVPVPHLFIISDEFAELKAQQPEFMAQLISAARIGRSLGVHLILATQKPSGVVDDQIWSNSRFRVCLKVQERSDSVEMIKRPDAAEIQETGRFYLQVGFNELYMLGQSAYSGADYVPAESFVKTDEAQVSFVDNLGRTIAEAKPKRKKSPDGKKQIVSIIEQISELAESEGIKPHRLWLDPIPAVICLEDIEERYGSEDQRTTLNPLVGEYDDPYNQYQGPLRLPLSEQGNCLLYGSTGSGKTSFFITLIAGLIRHHTPDELNLYILDFSAETLKLFERAPQVGGVVLRSEEEKLRNFFKLLENEMAARRSLFSDFGGDYQSYVRNSGSIIPNIVVVINNYSGLSESYEDLQDEFTSITRDCTRYGIYFVVSAGSTNAVRYRTQQNFAIQLVLQMNDESDYSVVVGRTEGVSPAKVKGRGLVRFDKVYEFQTAHAFREENEQKAIRELCDYMRNEYSDVAQQIPVLPEYVGFESLSAAITSLSAVPVGVYKDNLETAYISLKEHVVFPILAYDETQLVMFTADFLAVLAAQASVVFIDARRLFEMNPYEDEAGTDYNLLVRQLFDEMVRRNHLYIDAGRDPMSLSDKTEKCYVIFGFRYLYERLGDDEKDKLDVLLEKAESVYGIYFVLLDTSAGLGEHAGKNWFRKQLQGDAGIFIGSGITEQYVIKPSKYISQHYQEVENGFGYVITRNRPQLAKLLWLKEEE